MSIEVIQALVGTIDAKDKYTNGHSIRVAQYSKMISKALGDSEEEQKRVYYSALLHDIGKIGIPDTIINKPAALTKEEYDKKRKGILKEFWINYRRNRYGSILALKNGIHCK